MTLHPMGSFPHLHSPCDRCGYPRRYKQFATCCACTTPDRCPHPPIDRGGTHCRRCGGEVKGMPWENDPAWQERIRQAKQRVAECKMRDEGGPSPSIRPVDDH